MDREMRGDHDVVDILSHIESIRMGTVVRLATLGLNNEIECIAPHQNLSQIKIEFKGKWAFVILLSIKVHAACASVCARVRACARVCKGVHTHLWEDA